MRIICLFLSLSVLLLGGCSSYIARSGDDVSTLATRDEVHQALGEPSHSYRNKNGEFDDYRTQRMVAGQTEPITEEVLIDGEPRRNITGYREAEPIMEYVRYCIANCDWNEYRFELKSDAEKQAALEKLLASPKWKQSVQGSDCGFLTAQIKGTPSVNGWATGAP